MEIVQSKQKLWPFRALIWAAFGEQFENPSQGIFGNYLTGQLWNQIGCQLSNQLAVQTGALAVVER